jgi:hypothetical protein
MNQLSGTNEKGATVAGHPRLPEITIPGRPTAGPDLKGL